jgi:YHS domain-containing protein
MFTSSISVDALKSLTSGVDPVCGKDVKAADAAGSHAHAGKMYYFCSEACEKAFNADSEKYLKAKSGD